MFAWGTALITPHHLTNLMPTSGTSSSPVTSSSSKVTVQSIHEKLNTNQLPIFEFGRDLESLALEGVSSFELTNLYMKYVDSLRSYYYDVYMERCKQGSIVSLTEGRDMILTEAETAMKAAMAPSLAASLSCQVL